MADDALISSRRRSPALSSPADSNGISIRSANIQTLLSQIVFIVLLVRSACDPIFELSSVDMGGSTIGVGAAINALVIIIAILFIVQRPSAVPLAVFAIWAPYLLVALGATLHAPQPSAAARIFLVIVSYWAMFAMPFFMFRSPADLRRFVLLIFASSIIPSVDALWSIWFGLTDLSNFRLQSTFTHPNIFAFYLVLLLGLALYVRTSSAVRWSPRARWLISIYIAILVIFLAFTKTRSAWGAAALIFLVYALWFDRRFLFGFVVLPILLSNYTPFGDRLADLAVGEEIESFKQLNDSNQLNSFAWRQALWGSAIPSIEERPVIGHGLESFRPSTPQFFPLVGPEGIDAHNLYLQILFEMGAIGLLAYGWLLGSLAWWIKSGFRYDPDGIIVAFSVFIPYLLESYSDNLLYYLSFNWYFMFATGTICAWIECRRHRHRRPHFGGTNLPTAG